ncbi:MAG: hypothetical protein ACLTSZ_13250 [Lachnospiraceae bacterium]
MLIAVGGASAGVHRRGNDRSYFGVIRLAVPATNIKSLKLIVTVKREIRSLGERHETAHWHFLQQYKSTFEKRHPRSVHRLSGQIPSNIIAYETPADSDTTTASSPGLSCRGTDAFSLQNLGGSDNNVFAQHGIEGLGDSDLHETTYTPAQEYRSIP